MHKDVKMFCDTTKFPWLYIFGTHTKPHGVRGLSKHYHKQLDPKLAHGIFAIRQISCAYAECTSVLDKPWVTGFSPHQQPC